MMWKVSTSTLYCSEFRTNYCTVSTGGRWIYLSSTNEGTYKYKNEEDPHIMNEL